MRGVIEVMNLLEFFFYLDENLYGSDNFVIFPGI